MKPKKIVTIGGGTGSFMLLSGLKHYPVELSAIVSMADDGGSAGVLRDELGVLPPGDVRQCLVALSQSSEQMRELMNYRFEDGSFKGHSFGNLLVSALEKISGGMAQGLEEAADILNVSGRVIPVTEDDMRLVIELANGSVLHGEDELDVNVELRKQGVPIKSIALQSKVKPCQKALDALRDADAIIIGPGDQFGSLIPNLLISEIAEAVRDSKAHVVYVSGLTNKKGLTQNWSVEDYVQSIESYIGKGRIDSVIWNTRTIPENLVQKYEEQEGVDALVQVRSKERLSYTLVCADVADVNEVKGYAHDVISSTRSFIRHDSHDLAQAIMFAITMEENKKIIREIL